MDRTQQQQQGVAGVNAGQGRNTEGQAMAEIVTPHQHDVLCGRGGGTNNHVGNELFRQMVNSKKRDYLNCCKRDKPSVSRGIVTEIRNLNPPGRFLQRDEQTGLWYDIGDQKAREKTSQALREGAPDLRKELGYREWADGANPNGGVTPILGSASSSHRTGSKNAAAAAAASAAAAAASPSGGLSVLQGAAAAAAVPLGPHQAPLVPPRRGSAVSAAAAAAAAAQQQAQAAAAQHAFPPHISPEAAQALLDFLKKQQANASPGTTIVEQETTTASDRAANVLLHAHNHQKALSAPHHPHAAASAALRAAGEARRAATAAPAVIPSAVLSAANTHLRSPPHSGMVETSPPNNTSQSLAHMHPPPPCLPPHAANQGTTMVPPPTVQSRPPAPMSASAPPVPSIPPSCATQPMTSGRIAPLISYQPIHAPPPPPVAQNGPWWKRSPSRTPSMSGRVPFPVPNCSQPTKTQELHSSQVASPTAILAEGITSLSQEASLKGMAKALATTPQGQGFSQSNSAESTRMPQDNPPTQETTKVHEAEPDPQALAYQHHFTTLHPDVQSRLNLASDLALADANEAHEATQKVKRRCTLFQSLGILGVSVERVNRAVAQQESLEDLVAEVVKKAEEEEARLNTNEAKREGGDGGMDARELGDCKVCSKKDSGRQRTAERTYEDEDETKTEFGDTKNSAASEKTMQDHGDDRSHQTPQEKLPSNSGFLEDSPGPKITSDEDVREAKGIKRKFEAITIPASTLVESSECEENCQYPFTSKRVRAALDRIGVVVAVGSE